MSDWHAYKAQPVGSRAVEGAVIHLTEEIPEFDWRHGTASGLRDAEAIYQRQAERLADALTGALPGGTLNRLTAELLRRASGYLRVSLEPGDCQGEPDDA